VKGVTVSAGQNEAFGMVAGRREGQLGEMANAGIIRASAPACASGWQSAMAEALMSWAADSARKPWQ